MGLDKSVPASPLCFVLEPVPVEKSGEDQRENATEANSDGPESGAPQRVGKAHQVWTLDTACNPDIKALDTYFNELIEPTLGSHDFRIVRSTAIDYQGVVTRQHLNMAESADLMIANISSNDPVVFYCVAHRMGVFGEDNKRFKTIFLRHASSDDLLDLLGQDLVRFGIPENYDTRPVASNEAQTESDAIQRLHNARRSLTRAIAKFFDFRRRHIATKFADQRGPVPSRDGDAASTAASTPDGHKTAASEIDLDTLAKSFTEKVRAELKRDMTSVVRDVTRGYYPTEKF